MKKFLLTIYTIGAFAGMACAQCSELFFSEYQEGTFNNKALEIFNPTSVSVTLTGNYRIVRYSNGGTNNNTSPATGDYVQPLTGTIPSGGTFSAILDKRDPNATTADTILFAALLTKADSLVNAGMGAYYSPVYAASVQGSKCMPFNGDDAVSLEKFSGGIWNRVDIFGCIGERPTNGNHLFSPTGGWTDTAPYHTGIGAYISKDHTLIRNFGIQGGVTLNPDTGTFNALAEWDSLPVNTFTNLGYHDCLCTVGIKDLKNNSSRIAIYPNPSNGTVVYIRASDIIKSVELYNQLGEKIFETAENDFNKTFTLHTEKFEKGLYVVSVRMKDGTKSTRKINIQ